MPPVFDYVIPPWLLITLLNEMSLHNHESLREVDYAPQISQFADWWHGCVIVHTSLLSQPVFFFCCCCWLNPSVALILVESTLVNISHNTGNELIRQIISLHAYCVFLLYDPVVVDDLSGCEACPLLAINRWAWAPRRRTRTAPEYRAIGWIGQRCSCFQVNCIWLKHVRCPRKKIFIITNGSSVVVFLHSS